MPSFTHSSGALDVALLQGNIPQDEKFQSGSGVPVALQWYAEALRNAQADVTAARSETASARAEADRAAGATAAAAGNAAGAQERLAKTIAYVESLKPEQIAGREGRIGRHRRGVDRDVARLLGDGRSLAGRYRLLVGAL